MFNENNELYEFAGFRLNVGERKLDRISGDTNGSLPEKAFQTLVYLVRNSGRLITKEELLSTVWPDTTVEENNLGKAIHSIRHRLGDSSAEQKFIETVPKHGYRFVAKVARIGGSDPTDETPGTILSPADPESPAIRDRPEATSATRLPGSSTSRMVIAAVPLGIVLLAITAWFIWPVGLAVEPNSTPAEINAMEDDSPSAAAYDRYVRGKVKVASENREETEAAIRLLEEAVSLNPNLAEAYAQLARAHNTMAFKFNSGAESKKHHENAAVAIEKALRLNPNLAEAHFARGLILWTNTNRFPHEQSIRAYKRSLSIDPNSDETHHQLSLVYSHIGLTDEALRSVENALELNPNNTLARFRVGVYLQYQGKFEEAISVFKTIPSEHTPLLTDRSRAETLIQMGRLQEAEAIVDDYLQRFPQDEGGSFTSVKALLLASNRRYGEAEAAIRKANEIGVGYGHFHHTAYNIASAYAVMNKPDDAVRWLENAADGGFPNYPYFEIDPNLENIRNHDGFVTFMSKLRPQWERFKSSDA